MDEAGRPGTGPSATTGAIEAGGTAGPGAADLPFYELFARNPVAMYVIALDTLRFLAVNDAMVRRYGYDRDELLGMDLTQIRPLEEREAVRAKAANVAEGFDDAGIWRHRTKDGATILVSVTSHGLTFAGHRARLVAAHDVTDEQHVAEELRRSRDELAVVLQGIDDGVTVQDPRGGLVYANDQAARTLGFPTAAALLATPIGEIMHAFEVFDEAGNPFPLGELPGRRALQGEQPPRMTLRWRRRDTGEERWSVIGAAPVFDDAGRVRLAVNTFHDVTERMRAEEALRFLADAGEALGASLDYETTLSSLARLAVPTLADWCAVDLLGDDGAVRRLAVTHVDPAKVALAREIQERYPTDPRAPRGLPRVLRTGEAEFYPEIDDALLVASAHDHAHLEILRGVGLRSAMIVPLPGRERTLGALTLVSAESGRRYGREDLSLAVDLARRAAMAVDNARLYQAAQAAVRARDEFLSVAAHELRTPIAAMKGYAQLLRRAGRSAQGGTGLVASRDPERVERALRRIDESAGRLAALVDDLLVVATDRLGELPLRRRPVDLVALVREAIAATGDRLDGRHRLSVAGGDEPRIVPADPERIEQVVTNLLDNAIKYSPAGGEIRLALQPDREGVLLTVSDPGIGLPPGAAEAIFASFERTGPAVALGVSGFGLGLSICRRIVEQHGGKIWAESAGEDQGTVIAVWLPIETPAAAE